VIPDLQASVDDPIKTFPSALLYTVRQTVSAYYRTTKIKAGLGILPCERDIEIEIPRLMSFSPENFIQIRPRLYI